MVAVGPPRKQPMQPQKKGIFVHHVNFMGFFSMTPLKKGHLAQNLLQ
jgi:hypothetical protein